LSYHVDLVRFGQDAAQFDDPLLQKRGDLVLAVLEAAEQPVNCWVAERAEPVSGSRRRLGAGAPD
jgi:hypothetical protein